MEIQLKYDTKDDVMAYVIIPAVEAGHVASREDFDLDAIFDATFRYDEAEQAFVQVGDVDDFWAAVEKAAK